MAAGATTRVHGLSPTNNETMTRVLRKLKAARSVGPLPMEDRKMQRLTESVRNILSRPGLLAALVAICLCAVQAQAQRTTGTLRGQVLDPAEAVVPGATVTATNQDTSVSKTTATTSAGEYVFPDLLPGKYTVSVEGSGFKKSSLSDVTVVANQVNEADLRLEIGQVSEMVTVSAAPQLVETTNSTLSSTFTERQVVDLPTGLPSPLNL